MKNDEWVFFHRLFKYRWPQALYKGYLLSVKPLIK